MLYASLALFSFCPSGIYGLSNIRLGSLHLFLVSFLFLWRINVIDKLLQDYRYTTG